MRLQEPAVLNAIGKIEDAVSRIDKGMAWLRHVAEPGDGATAQARWRLASQLLISTAHLNGATTWPLRTSCIASVASNGRPNMKPCTISVPDVWTVA